LIDRLTSPRQPAASPSPQDRRDRLEQTMIRSTVT
jgi:hypothetical protein